MTKKVTHVSVEELGKSKAWTFIDCFSSESTEHWIRIFAGKRWDTVTALDDLDLGDEKNYNKYRKDFIRGFTSEMKMLVDRKKKLLRSNKKESE